MPSHFIRTSHFGSASRSRASAAGSFSSLTRLPRTSSVRSLRSSSISNAGAPNATALPSVQARASPGSSALASSIAARSFSDAAGEAGTVGEGDIAGIDVDVKDMLKAAWGTKNIKEACNLDGLIVKLEGISEQLDMCKKSLADFLDGRRRQFPRYYFTSEADLLDILSNGAQPRSIPRRCRRANCALQLRACRRARNRCYRCLPLRSSRTSKGRFRSGAGTGFCGAHTYAL